MVFVSVIHSLLSMRKRNSSFIYIYIFVSRGEMKKASLPSNQLPYMARKHLPASSIDAHFTYTQPCKRTIISMNLRYLVFYKIFAELNTLMHTFTKWRHVSRHLRKKTNVFFPPKVWPLFKTK